MKYWVLLEMNFFFSFNIFLELKNMVFLGRKFRKLLEMLREYLQEFSKYFS